jgi:hypothetical protein
MLRGTIPSTLLQQDVLKHGRCYATKKVEDMSFTELQGEVQECWKLRLAKVDHL